MSKNRSTDRNDKLLEAMFRVALEETIDRDMNALPNTEELNKIFPRSDAVDKKFRELVSSNAQKDSGKRISQGFVKVVASIIVMFILSAIALLSVEASRSFIFNTIINIQDDHVAFDFGDVLYNGEYDSNIPIFYIDGFEYIGGRRHYTRNTFIYENIFGEQIILQQHKGMSLRVLIDNEHREFTIKRVESNDVYIFAATSNDYSHIIMWAQGDNVLNLVSNMELEHLINIVVDIIYD